MVFRHKDPRKHDFWYPPTLGLGTGMWSLGPLFWALVLSSWPTADDIHPA